MLERTYIIEVHGKLIYLGSIGSFEQRCGYRVEFDLLLPTVVFIVVVAAVFLHQKLEKRIIPLFEEKKLGVREAVLMVLAMGLLVTVIAFLPSRAVQILYISVYSFAMFSLTFLASRRWYIAVIPPLLFTLSYFLYWTLYTLNLSAAIFAVIITVYVGALFSWRTTWIFAILLTVIDVIQVLVTGSMGELADKALSLSLPVFIVLPTFPAKGMMVLGLGDIFLSGLLSLQTVLRRGRKIGILTAATISIAMFVFEILLFNVVYTGYFPATIVVISGWLVGIGTTWLIYPGNDCTRTK